MINQSDIHEQNNHSEKLVLPTPPAEEQQAYYVGQMAQFRPEQLIRSQAQPAPAGVKAKLAFYWHKDPAYKVLMIAMTTVLVAGVVFVSLASAAFLSNSNLFSSSYIPQSIPKGTGPTGVNPHPTFAPPGGGSGTNQQSSQPPLRPTPAIQPTNPADQQTPTAGGGGTLNVQFTSIPNQVTNGSYVSVGVNTGEPNATVKLFIRYSGQSGRSTAGPQVSDSNGDATIGWFVLTSVFGHKTVQAYVYAVATDQNGQSSRSQTVVVQVLTRGVG